MKTHNIALFALAAVFAAGCSPSNPPSGYDKDGNPIYDNPYGKNVANTDLIQDAGTGAGNADGLNSRGKAGGWSDPANGFTGGPESIPEGAKLCVILFGFDKYSVESGERAKIDASLAAMKGKRIAAFGYTDFFGTEDYNLGLSDKRANSVKEYVAQIGGGEADVRAYGEQFAKQSGDKNSVADDRKVILVDLDYQGN